MSEELQKVGLYFDDIYRLRVEEPTIANERSELREECLEYAKRLLEFKKISVEFHKVLSSYSKDVEREKIRAISTQNRLKTISKQRQAEQQVYQVRHLIPKICCKFILRFRVKFLRKQPSWSA